jgi:NhaP-type Na+/H+ or K+/H+ antiporter
VSFADVALVAGFVFAYSLFSRRLADTVVTGPMVFVAAGILIGPEVLDLVDLDVEAELVQILAEVTLALVLFSDATRIQLGLRHEVALPARLLGVGLPLTIGLGTVAALLLFGDLTFWEAALIGAILAPTDAALGQLVVSSDKIPVRVRQALNVESGLNDGIAAPVVTLFLALAAIQLDVETPGYWAVFTLEQIGFGILVGVGIGYFGGRLVDECAGRGWMEGAYRQLSTLAVAFVAWGFASAIDGNGFIAAFAAGLTFGVAARDHCRHVGDFTEDEGQLLTLLTFLLFGVAIAGPALTELTWQVALYAVLSLTVVRMVPTAIAMVGGGLKPETVLLLGWFGPRGLASIVFGLTVVEADLAGGSQLYLVVTWTVLASIVAHGVTARPATAWYARRYADRADEHEDMPESTEVRDLPTRYAWSRRPPRS